MVTGEEDKAASGATGTGTRNGITPQTELWSSDLVTVLVGSLSLIQEINTNYKAYLQTRDQSRLLMATELNRKLEGVLEASEGVGLKTMPIGLFHSAGSGFTTLPAELVAQLEARIPYAKIQYGYIKLPPENAEFSAQTFWHLHKQRKQVKLQEADKRTGNASLDALLRHAYIPLPDPIDDDMPIVGPLPLNEKLSSLITSWVRGPTLHSQMKAISALAKRQNTLFSEYADARLWVISQMTGVWQATPPPIQIDMNDLNLPERVRQHYQKTLNNSLLGYAELLNVKLTPKQTQDLSNLCSHIAEDLPIDTGNIGRYFDAALRNFIDEVGNVRGTHQDAFNIAIINRQVDELLLWNLTRRVDFSHVAERPIAVYEEDSSHITRNWQAKLSREQTSRYHAVITATRQALVAYNSGDLKKAIETSEELAALRARSLRPDEMKTLESYHARYGKTIDVMPWIRQVRQGYLALVYASKAMAAQENSKDNLGGVIDELVREEANTYLRRSSRELPEIQSRLGIKEGHPMYDGIRVLKELLSTAEEHSKSFNINKENMIHQGTQIMNRYKPAA